MNQKIRMFPAILWGALILCLLAAASGSLLLRMENEQKNNTILSVADYEKFSEYAYCSESSPDEMLDELQKAGVHAVAVKELSLRSLAEQGKISLEEFGAFLGYTRVYRPELYALMREQISPDTVNPYALVVVSTEAETTDLLEERLGNRLSPDEWLQFQQGDESFFLLLCALSPLNPQVKDDTDPDMRLGFDLAAIEKLRARDFDVALRPGITLGSNNAYRSEYEEVIRDYGVKTVIFATSVLKATPEDVHFFARLTKEYGLTIGVIENSNQILYIEQAGLNALMEETDYAINRTYSTSSDDYVKQKSERYYRWVRAVIDRGLRIMCIQPFKDNTHTIGENLRDTYEIIGQFHETMKEKGFSTRGELPALDASRPGMMNRALLAVSLAIGCLLYIWYLFRPKKRLFLLLLALGILGAAGINGIGMDFTKVYALGAAILYPTLSGLLVLLLLKNFPQWHWLKKTVLSLVILLAVNALGMITLTSALCDLRFILYVKTFSGVKLAFMLPLLLFMLNYLLVFYRDKQISATIVRLAQMHPTYLVLGIGVILLLAVYVYLGRSGNDSGITVSSLELRVREILETVFLARPRFKEIIIGYPCLFMMVYLFHRYRYPLLTLVLGLGMMMGSISMTNTFCHVFAAVQISASRTLAGLLIGVLIGICALIGVKLLELLLFHFFPQCRKFVQTK